MNLKPKFNICISTGAAVVDEFALALSWGLQQLGFKCKIHYGGVDSEAINIQLASMGLNAHDMKLVAPSSIVFNLEQTGSYQSAFNSARYFVLMKNFPVWDYSLKNIEILSKYGINQVSRVRIGFSPVLERVIKIKSDIDVLFYGSINQRRLDILKKIENEGLKVVYSFKEWTTAERDNYIARSKIVLNIGYFDDVHIFEEIRVSYLLNNAICVVSELRDNSEIEADMRHTCAFESIENIPKLCKTLAADPVKRQQIANSGYEIFKKRDWLSTLKSVIADYIESNTNTAAKEMLPISIPNKLNIGSGRSWKYDCLNLDINTQRGADLIFDLNHCFDHTREYKTWRFGNVVIPKGYFQYILAEHVFEHVSNLTQCMTTCLDLLQVGGVLEVEVPYELSLGAWQDPTHVRAMNEKSWAYYSGVDCWYVGWREFAFDLIMQNFIFEPYGAKLFDSGVTLEELLRTPRTIAAQRVKLQKRALTDDEKNNHADYFREIMVEE